MKKNLIFIFTLLVYLTLGYSAMANTHIALPNPLGNTQTFCQLITSVINYISTIIASLAGIVFIWAGILFLTSAGNPGQIEKARKAILYGAIGAAIALAGQGLVLTITGIIGVTAPTC